MSSNKAKDVKGQGLRKSRGQALRLAANQQVTDPAVLREKFARRLGTKKPTTQEESEQ